MAYFGVTILCVIFSIINAEHFTEDEKKVMVSTHNLIRSSAEDPPAANMLQVRWDDFLAAKANSWVEMCQNKNDRFINKDPGIWKRLGQNNWAGSIENFEASPGVPAWMWVKHGQEYSFKSKRCDDKVSFKDCSDFTQVIMATTEAIGCAKMKCPEDEPKELYVTCFYGPGGSLLFKNPYVVGDPCSKCPKKYTCNDNLCVPPPPPSERELMEELLGYLHEE
ncbi:peptidase inhibitor 16-like [Patiria miniata]|uniref:SCP domain-containing protein n=1 Tax=Patiria miniata TaxID=46514 RepID=A0A914AXN4_PATMI|nr:peptidase inhibitor 16-like [Patiria miniata]XP_038068900.1 peptidase inhibitor 16-like [Patiria miniata]